MGGRRICCLEIEMALFVGFTGWGRGEDIQKLDREGSEQYEGERRGWRSGGCMWMWVDCVEAVELIEGGIGGIV